MTLMCCGELMRDISDEISDGHSVDREHTFQCRLCGKTAADYVWRDKFKPGNIVEVDFSEEVFGEEFSELQKYNGIRAIIVRSLGMHEDLAGTLDYVVSWDWTDERLLSFLIAFRTSDYMLDPRMPEYFLKMAEDQKHITKWDVEFYKARLAQKSVERKD